MGGAARLIGTKAEFFLFGGEAEQHAVHARAVTQNQHAVAKFLCVVFIDIFVIRRGGPYKTSRCSGLSAFRSFFCHDCFASSLQFAGNSLDRIIVACGPLP